MGDLDKVIALARLPEVTLTTFGDLIRVPASRSSLAAERAAGADVRVVYSARDAVEIAAAEPERQVVFAGIGFETTAPTVGAALLEAQARGLSNFSVLSMHKTMPLPLKALLELGETDISGFILPGHVSVVTGSGCYEFLARDHGVGRRDRRLRGARRAAGTAAARAPDRAGDRDRVRARRAPRGQRRGAAPHGAGVRAGRRRLARPRRDPRLGPAPARRVRRLRRGAPLRVDAGEPLEPKGCRCGEVLRGVLDPAECALFGARCTPEDPVGACMVSSEGACAARYRYRGIDD